MGFRYISASSAAFLSLVLIGCQGLRPAPPVQLTVNMSGAGTGTVTSSPAGINCPTTCTVPFPSGTQITLSETPASGTTFSGWSGACTGTTSCTVTLNGASTVTAIFGGSLQSINHIILFAQENRSLDHYFGALRHYWAQHGIADQPFDGLPQFNPITDPAFGPPPSLPGCDPTNPHGPNFCSVSPTVKVSSFAMQSVCTEELSPFWNEAHRDWNLNVPTSATPTLDGFVVAGADDARQYSVTFNGGTPVNDVNGYRTMGYFTDSDLPYYYSLASNFAISDRWFAPIMSRTQLNRMFMLAATSGGHAYPLGEGSVLTGPLTNKTIFEELQDAGITWRVYVNPAHTTDPDNNNAPCSSENPINSCLAKNSYVSMFTYESTIQSTPALLQNFVPISQLATDLQNDTTFPQVVLIEPASNAGLDEHPSDTDAAPVNIRDGAAYAAGLINSLMGSPSWKDSVMIFTYDEPGGFYDHVAPQVVPPPDQTNLYPFDLESGDECAGMNATSGICSFGMTGYRVPVVVISPFAKKNYVSHTVRDTTAWLNLIEERFNVAALTARDAAWGTAANPVATMDEFFDFAGVPWATPPSLPSQPTGGNCSTAAPTP